VKSASNGTQRNSPFFVPVAGNIISPVSPIVLSAGGMGKLWRLFLKIRLFGRADSFSPTSRTGINVKILIHPTANCRIEGVDLISHQGLWPCTFTFGQK
jgi:hypothetical protein